MCSATQIDELRRQLRVVEQRLRSLEVRQHPAMVPQIEPWESTFCKKCGVEWKGTMGYSCPNMACPIGAGPTIG